MADGASGPVRVSDGGALGWERNRDRPDSNPSGEAEN